MMTSVAFGVGWLVAALRSLCCRHRDDQIVRQSGRIYLRCPDCGRHSRGITLDCPPPKPVAVEPPVVSPIGVSQEEEEAYWRWVEAESAYFYERTNEGAWG